MRNDSEGNDSDAVQANEAILPLGQRTTAEGVIPISEGEVRTRDVRGAHDPRAGIETIEAHLNKIKRKISEANGEFARLSMSAMSGMAMGPEARRCAIQTRGVAENALGALHGLSRQLALNEALREELPLYEEAITTLSNHARNLARDARTSIELSESQPTYVEETTNGKTRDERRYDPATILMDPRNAKERPVFYVSTDERHDTSKYFTQIESNFASAIAYATAAGENPRPLTEFAKVAYLEASLRSSGIPDIDAILERRTPEERREYHALKLFVYSVLSGPEFLQRDADRLGSWSWTTGQFSSLVASKLALKGRLLDQAEAMDSILPTPILERIRATARATSLLQGAEEAVYASDRVPIQAGDPISIAITALRRERTTEWASSLRQSNPMLDRFAIAEFAAEKAAEECLSALAKRVDECLSATMRTGNVPKVASTRLYAVNTDAVTTDVNVITHGGGHPTSAKRAVNQLNRCFICDQMGHGFALCPEPMKGVPSEVIKRASLGPNGTTIPIKSPTVPTKTNLIEAIKKGRREFYAKWRKSKHWRVAREQVARLKMIQDCDVDDDDVIALCVALVDDDDENELSSSSDDELF